MSRREGYVETEFKHFDCGFRCIAEGYEDMSDAKVCCNHLQADVRELKAEETKELFLALLRSDEAFANDPIWGSPALQKLCRMQHAARIARLQYEPEHIGGKNECSCRLIPATGD
jgi:hypothetical protein